MRTEIQRAPRFAAIAAAIMIGLGTLAGYSFYTGHSAGCGNKDVTADLFRDVIVLATTPPKGSKPLTPAQKAERDAFRKPIFARIDLIRC